jgi:hypothetical protein
MGGWGAGGEAIDGRPPRGGKVNVHYTKAWRSRDGMSERFGGRFAP